MKRHVRTLAGLAAALALAGLAPGLRAQPPAADLVVQAGDAFRAKDKARLATLRAAANAANHPLAMWVEYFELTNRLAEAQQPELDAFAARWSGSYVEDRLRNDWLLELGKRRDWANFRAEFPRFRMNDDREVTCYSLLVQHLDGQDVRERARAAWYAQRDTDDGCQLLGQTLYDARVLRAEDVWEEIYLSVEANRPRAARAAAALLDPALGALVDALFKDPARMLRGKTGKKGLAHDRLAVLGLWRLAAADPDAAVLQLQQFAPRMGAPELADAWAGVARQAAFKLHPGSADFARRAWSAWDRAGKAAGANVTAPRWSDETLAWQVRAALRENGAERPRWQLVARAVDAMSAAEQRDAAWVYWRARATQALAAEGPDGDGARALARLALESIAGQLGFYGQLAAEDLGRAPRLPGVPTPLADAERDAVRTHPGLARGLALIELGLRSEGVREWNFSLRGMNERELRASAQWACEREVWDRCINTSDRTRQEIDLAQRFPTPFREQVTAKAREIGVDPAYVYGLIRQESRFILDARSHVGASGLMQLMPATARWTAKKVGLRWSQDLITDRDVNLRLGMTYLKLLLDDFGGSGVMAAAAYNAGPGRPRRWREGAVVEPAAWIEGIPFNETRDYVKKVISNALVYSAVLDGAEPRPLKARLGAPIGPRDPGAPSADRELP